MLNQIHNNTNINFNFLWVKEQIRAAIQLGNWEIVNSSLSEMGENYIVCALHALEEIIFYCQSRADRQLEFELTLGEMRFLRNALEWELRLRNKKAS